MTIWSLFMPTTEPAPNGKIKGALRKVPNRRDRRKLATRQALLDATLALLASRSIDALSVDEIAAQADVAKGTFYNYFPEKEALARELAARVRARLEDEITRANEGIADPAERIARAFCYMLRFCRAVPEQATALARLFPHATDPAAPLNSGARRDAADGIAQGRIVAPSEEAAVTYIMGVFMAGANRVLDLSAKRAREFAQELGAMLLHGLGIGRAQAAQLMRDAAESILS
jgi:AcrR family transcriptional regulator